MKNKFYLILLIISTLFMSIGYASINSISLGISGSIHSQAQSGIFIHNVEYLSNVDADITNSTIINAYQKLLNNKVVLSKDNSNSSLTYKISMYNSTDIDQTFLGINYDSEFNNNKNITYFVEGLNSGDIIASKGYLNFTITFHYNDNKIPTVDDENYIENYNILDSYLSFNFGDYDLEIVDTMTYSLYDENQKIPVVVNNNNDYEVNGRITYNDVILVDNFVLEANSINNIITVDISSIYSNLNEGNIYSLDLTFLSPVIETYDSVVSFKKEQSVVDIVSVETYVNNVLSDNNLNYTENTIIVDNNLDNDSSLISYKITVKNNSTTDIYKLRNITEVINSNSSSNYVADIDLADGILIKPLRELTFTISYNYDSSIEDNSHRQILFFDFRWNYTFGAVTDHLITISNDENKSDGLYGDFGVLTSSDSLLNDMCTYESCYSDNNGNFEYDISGGLVLDQDNPIGTLNIDQSMSVEDEYSVYTTFKADSSQAGDDSFPATIVAISEGNALYLTWIGIYQNYLHIYSYRSSNAMSEINYEHQLESFISFDISKYSNKTINLQVTGIRGGKTNVYINGELLKTFTSGSAVVNYNFATIGDLRPGRNLKFTGTIYDIALYNKALSSDEVNTNWLYAQEKWKIS